jgi:glycerol kinase
VARASRPVESRFPRPGWVEQDPLDLWRGVREAMDACLHDREDTPLALAITNQRESVVLWERRTGRPLGPVIGWQCRRTAPACEELRRRGLEPLLRERTGLTVDPMFSATKARWLLDHADDGHRRAERGELCLGTIDSWLLWNLTGGEVHATDLTNASRTQLLDLTRLSWDPELLQVFGVPAAALPRIEPSGARFGPTLRLGRLRAGTPVAAMAGDSHAALFGHGAFRPGAVKATYGTGTSLMTPVPALRAAAGLSSTLACARGAAVYALEGNIPVTGAAVDWLGALLGFADPAAEVFARAASAPDTGGVFVVPAFAGLGAPHWDAGARGLICGLHRGTTAAHLARAVLESIAFLVRDVLEAMEPAAGVRLGALLADGGASRSGLLMQLQADLLGRPVERPVTADAAALGVAYLAGLEVGLWPSPGAVAGLARPRERFEPRLPAEEREQRYAGWRAAVARARSGPGEASP